MEKVISLISHKFIFAGVIMNIKTTSTDEHIPIVEKVLIFS